MKEGILDIQIIKGPTMDGTIEINSNTKAILAIVEKVLVWFSPKI